MVYEQWPNGTVTLAEVAIPNGTLYRSRPADGTQGPRYVYSLTDYLGNVRAVVPRGWNPTATPPPGQEWIRRLSFFSDYYPFGWSQPGRDMGLYRYGFQGQEKDPETDWWAFQLRMYDGRVGRWMTVDPKKQYASPYRAMGNNPMNGTDPDGGFFLVDSWVIGGIKGLFNGEGFFASASRHFNNDLKIWQGLDQGTFGQKLSRLTWELPQTIFGFAISQAANTLGKVTDVRHFMGATNVTIDNFFFIKPPGAITLGSYINGSPDFYDFSSPLNFQHEYGHYLQSRSWGPLYIPYGILSLPSAGISMIFGTEHMSLYIERNANKRAALFFRRPEYNWRNTR